MPGQQAAPMRQGGFSNERSAKLLELEQSHFWFGARTRLIQRMLTPRLGAARAVLDVGCGGAALSRGLAAHGHRVLGVDRSPIALRALSSRGPAMLPLRADATALPVRNSSIDAALALDVLEHVDDDRMLRSLHRALVPSGLLMVTVPAAPWLWSHRDEAAGHLRRYTRASLLGLLRETGFEVLESQYYQCLLFPLLATTRLLGKRGPALRDVEDEPSALTNWALGQINGLEVGLGRVVRWPFGSSLAVLGRKRA